MYKEQAQVYEYSKELQREGERSKRFTEETRQRDSLKIYQRDTPNRTIPTIQSTLKIHRRYQMDGHKVLANCGSVGKQGAVFAVGSRWAIIISDRQADVNDVDIARSAA